MTTCGRSRSLLTSASYAWSAFEGESQGAVKSPCSVAPHPWLVRSDHPLAVASDHYDDHMSKEVTASVAKAKLHATALEHGWPLVTMDQGMHDYPADRSAAIW